MVNGLRAWLVGATALVAVVALVGVALIATRNDSTSPPRVRVSVPGLETEADLFGEASEPMTNSAEVIEIDGIEPLRAAFDADQGHPRMILLVDPI